MSRILSLLMALMALVAFEAFLFPGLALAQKERCSQTAFAYDPTCSESDACGQAPNAQCLFKQFEAECTGTYTIDAWTTCESGGCEHCMACVYVVDPQGDVLARCYSNFCHTGQCGRTCSGLNGVFLTAGVEYKLWVCLIPCFEGNRCNEVSCNSTCVAHACVRIGVAAPCY